MKFLLTLLAWLAWNIAEMEIRRRELDEDGNPQTNFSFAIYAKAKRFIWAGSFVMIFILLIIGKMKIDISKLGDIVGTDLSWNDLYYLAPGIGFEAIIFGIRWIQKYFSKRLTQ